MRNMRPVLIGLAGALVALVIVSQLTSRQRLATVEGGGFLELIPDAFDPASVETIVAYLGASPDSSVELAREGDGWVVTTAWGWPARTTLVDRLFTDLGELRGEIRSGTEDVLGDYEIDDRTGLHIIGKGSGGSEIFHIVAGKTAERGGSFVRNAGSSEVAYTKKTPRSHFGIWSEPKAPEARRWLDLTIHRAERNDVDRIVIRDGEDEIVLAKHFETPEVAEGDTTGIVPEIDRTKWTWEPDDQGPIFKQKADAVLGVLTGLNATDVVPSDSLETYGLGDGARSALVTFESGESTRILFGAVSPADSTRVYAVREGGKPAVVHKSTVDRIFVSRDELSPPES